jgi:sulfite exporter TauE/SafE
VLTSILAAAAALGVLGTLHCALMCGPLALAGCGARGARAAGAYLGGRLAAHALAGAVFGAAGANAARVLSAPTAQLVLVSAIAAAMLAQGVGLLVGRPAPTLVPLGLRRREPSRVAAFLVSLLPRRALPLGLATGALPCGMLAGGWALAAATGSPLHGALAMVVFSIATAPGLVAVVLSGIGASRAAGRLTARWKGALFCAVALSLGLRLLLEQAHHGCH